MKVRRWAGEDEEWLPKKKVDSFLSTVQKQGNLLQTDVYTPRRVEPRLGRVQGSGQTTSPSL